MHTVGVWRHFLLSWRICSTTKWVFPQVTWAESFLLCTAIKALLDVLEISKDVAHLGATVFWTYDAISVKQSRLEFWPLTFYLRVYACVFKDHVDLFIQGRNATTAAIKTDWTAAYFNGVLMKTEVCTRHKQSISDSSQLCWPVPSLYSGSSPAWRQFSPCMDSHELGDHPCCQSQCSLLISLM